MLRQGAAERDPARKGLASAELESLSRKEPRGHAIEVRAYAENPARNFEPSPGLLQCVNWASHEGVRIDGWVVTGTVVSPFYDPMLAK
jgi:urea carboxylase